MPPGFSGNLIFAIIARMLCGNHLNKNTQRRSSTGVEESNSELLKSEYLGPVHTNLFSNENGAVLWLQFRAKSRADILKCGYVEFI